MQLFKTVSFLLRTDSTAAKSNTTKYGLGKNSKHIQLRYLYMQDLVRAGLLTVKHIGTKHNSADALTKYLGRELLQHHIAGLSLSTEHKGVTTQVN